MSFLLLGLQLLLAVHLLVAAALSVAVVVALRAFDARLRALAPARRASWLLAAGLLPAAGGLAAAFGMVLPAWIRHEPPDTTERAGLALLLLAGLGAVLVAWRLGGAFRDARRTRLMVESFTRDARAGKASFSRDPHAEDSRDFPAALVPVAYPLAALHGAFWPRLLLSRGLVAALEPDELEAVVEHERAHLVAHENLKRLLLRASPDPLAVTAFGVRVRAAY
jgi:Zn-dependent protease with chaperone function